MDHVAASEIYLGLMSGTSLDGVDGVAVDWSTGSQQVLGHLHAPFPEGLRAELLALNQANPGGNELHRAAVAALHVARVYAEVVRGLLEHLHLSPSRVRALGAHGQTVRHQPQAAAPGLPGYSIQLLNGAFLAELSGVDVVADMRSRDLAAGGQGAPLAPAFHQAMFARAGHSRAVLNVGGFSNLTVLDGRSEAMQVTGMDCGPGNVLMDAWAQQHLGQPMDAAGAWAAGGRVVPELLRRLWSDPFFHQPPPKSTGRDVFHLPWLQQHLDSMSASASPRDVQSTLCELSAQCVAHEVREHAASAAELIVCGGGAYNDELMGRLRALLPAVRVDSSEHHGLPPHHVEACAFAWLARQHCLRLAGNLASVTGAAGPRVLGALYPA